jgi:hypothetical protein
MHDPAQETWDAVNKACDALHCNEGYVQMTHMRDPGPAFAFQFYDYDLEQKWAADGGDPEDPPSTVPPPDVLRRLLKVTSELGVECTLRADLVDSVGSDAFEAAYSALLWERV